MDARTSAALASCITAAVILIGWSIGGAALIEALLPIAGAAALLVGIMLNITGVRVLRQARQRKQHRVTPIRLVQEAPHTIAAGPRSGAPAFDMSRPASESPLSPPVTAVPPSRLDRYIALGQAHYSRGETERAIAILQRAATMYPDRKEPYRELAAVYIREHDLLQAVEWVERGVEQDLSLRRDILENPLFDALRDEEATHERYERLLRVG